LHKDIRNVEGSFCIILLCFVHFCTDMPDDSRTVETCSTLLVGEILQQTPRLFIPAKYLAKLCFC